MAVDIPGIENGLDGSVSDQTSTTTYGDYRNDFPTPGVDQPSETFRINYKVFQEAIENLQGRTLTITGAASSAPVTIGSGSGNIDIPISLSGSFLPTDGSGSMTGNLVLDTPAIITTSSDHHLQLTPDGVGRLYLQGLIWPNVDGTSSQALITDGSGNLGWGTFMTALADDAAPTLGGNLTVGTFDILGGPDIGLVTSAGRVVVSGSGPGPEDGVVSAGDAAAASNQPGGILRLQGGDGDGIGLGGDVVLGNAPGGNPLDDTLRGRVLIGYKDPTAGSGATHAIWPEFDGTAGQVLGTDGLGNLTWTTGGGGGGGITTISANDPINVVSPTGPFTTLNFDIDGLTEKVAPTGSDWVIIQEAVGGAFVKAQTQNLPGSGGAGGTAGLLQRALVYQAAPFPIPNATPTKVIWQFVAAETPGSSWFSSGTPTRLTVPTGITQIRLQAGIRMAASSTGTINVLVYKNGTPFAPLTIGVPSTSMDPRQAGQEHTLSISSPTLDVAPLDYFEIEITQTSGSPVNLLAENSFFAMEESVTGAQVLNDLIDVSVGNPPAPGEDGYVLTWDDGAGTFILTPRQAPAAGTNMQIQYNNSDTLAGDTGFTTDGAGSIDITGDLDVDNINIDGNTISSSNIDGDILISPNGLGETFVTSLLQVASLRFADTGSDTNNWIMAEDGTNNLVFTYNTAQLTMASTGELTVANVIQTGAGIDLELVAGTGGLVTTYSGYDMSAGANEVLATKGYVDGIAGSSTLAGLTDTNITSPVLDDFLRYDGAEWVNAAVTVGHGTAASIDDHVDVDVTTLAPNSGATLTYNTANTAWETNNSLYYIFPGSGGSTDEELYFTNQADTTLEAAIKVRPSLGTCSIQSTVSDDTDKAQLVIQRNAATAATNDVAFFIETVTSSRQISLNVRDPNAGFAVIDEIIIDTDNSGIDMGGLTMSNVAIENGVTGSRPGTPVTGQMYFDTTVGRPTWYDGTNWIQADGTIVP